MFLRDLIQRTFSPDAPISPRRASRFEPSIDVPETATIETAPATEASKLPAIQPPAVPLSKPLPIDRIETVVVDRPVEVTSEPRAPLEVVTRERIVVSEMPVAAQRPLPVEQPGAKQVLSPVALTATPPEAHPPPVQETVLKSALMERVEVRVDSRTIETRLESLVRERGVERVERIVTQAVPVVPSIAPAVRATPAMAPQRSFVAPEMRQMPQLKPMFPGIAETPAPTTVHVTIGRVEVRATPSAPARQMPRTNTTKLGLDDYLQRREKA